RAAEEPRDVLREDVQHFAGSVPSRDAFGVGGKGRKGAVPTGREFAPLHLLDFNRKLRGLGAVTSEKSSPFLPGLRPACAGAGGKMFGDGVGHKELGVFGPAVAALGEPNLVVSQRFAVSCSCVLLMRGTVADVTVQNNKGGPFFGLTEDVEGMLNTLDVVSVADTQHIPSVGKKSCLNVFGEGDARGALDGDVVVVVDPAKVVEPEMGR